jgi:hypothetical protein
MAKNRFSDANIQATPIIFSRIRIVGKATACSGLGRRQRLRLAVLTIIFWRSLTYEGAISYISVMALDVMASD